MPITGMKQVRLAIGDLKESANDDVRKIVLGGVARVIDETPFDTGRARNNWKGSAKRMPRWVLNKKLILVNNLPYINTLEYGGYPKNPKKGSWIKGEYQKLSTGGYSKQLLPMGTPKGWVRAAVLKMRKKIRAL